MDAPQLRIGDAEREDALQALGEHMRVGRLDIDEYADRSARVTAAKTRGELDEVFIDLPEPHPRPTGLVSRPAATIEPVTGSAVARRDERPVSQRLAGALVPLSCVLAFVLFFAAHVSWVIFLLPVAIGIIAGVIWGDDRKRKHDKPQ